MSDHRLARWLRSDSAGPMLRVLDQVIADIGRANVAGAATHLRSIRTEPDAFLEVMTEAYFLRWLIHSGFPFTLPRAGPDFLIDLGGADPFGFEATTPRKTDWLDELVGRLRWVGARTSYRGRLVYTLERLPALDSQARTLIVERALHSITAAGAQGRRSVTQSYQRRFGLGIRWQADPTPSFATAAAGSASPEAGFELVADAAATKTHQIPSNRAGGLLLGTSQLPIAVRLFIDVVRGASPQELQALTHRLLPAWKRVPPQIKHVCLYELSLDRLDPFRTTWLVNPLSPFPDPPGFVAFRSAASF